MAKKNLVLITRPEEDAYLFAQELESEGFQTFIEPILAIKSLPVTMPDLGTYGAILLTSANGVRLLAASTNIRDIPLYVVGPHTQKTATEAGFFDVIPAGGTAESLLRTVKNRAEAATAGKKFLHLRGEHVAKPLAPALRKAGFAVDELIMYRAVPANALTPRCIAALKNGDIDVATFFSRRSALNFLELVEKQGLSHALKNIKALSISASVLKCVQPGEWKSTHIAQTPDREGFLKVLRRLCL